MSNSKGHHPVRSRRRSSDGVEWSCVAGLKLRCAAGERCCPGRRQRQPRFSDRDRPEKSDPHCRMGPKIPTNYYYYNYANLKHNIYQLKSSTCHGAHKLVSPFCVLLGLIPFSQNCIQNKCQTCSFSLLILILPQRVEGWVDLVGWLHADMVHPPALSPVLVITGPYL